MNCRSLALAPTGTPTVLPDPTAYCYAVDTKDRGAFQNLVQSKAGASECGRVIMQIPEAFYDFCLLLHQDSFILYGREPEDVAAGPLQYMSKEQKVALRAFLDHLLTGNY